MLYQTPRDIRGELILRHVIAAAAICISLSACSDPLEEFDRITDVDLAEDSSAVSLAPAAVDLPVNAAQADAPASTSGGFWSRLTGGASPDAQTVPASATAPRSLLASAPPPRGDVSIEARYRDVTPFGQVARVCDARRQPLGRLIEKSRPNGYALYDSDPGNTTPHTFYITGFKDGCPRQFTAAVALLGAPSMHEQIRYGLPGETHPYSDTDKAYERIKAQVCGVGRGKPCGSAIRRMDRSTVFVSAYERYGAAPRWADVLIHDGVVVAKAIKTGD